MRETFSEGNKARQVNSLAAAAAELLTDPKSAKEIRRAPLINSDDLRLVAQGVVGRISLASHKAMT
jgi:hypothetical protein